jgi:type IV secretion system T-DNA border endonuclease VirD2
LRSEGSRGATDSDRRTNGQALAVARGHETFPTFIARGTARWEAIRGAYWTTAELLDQTRDFEDFKLANDVRAFLDLNPKMNATPEVFAARHAQLLQERSRSDVDPDARPPTDRGRSR